MKKQLQHPFYYNIFQSLRRDKPKARIIIFFLLLEKGQWRNRRWSPLQVHLNKLAWELGYDRVEFVRIKRWKFGWDIHAGIDEACRYFDAFRFQKQKRGVSVSATLAFEEPALFSKHVSDIHRELLESWAQILSVNDILCEAARKPEEDEISLEDWVRWENL